MADYGDDSSVESPAAEAAPAPAPAPEPAAEAPAAAAPTAEAAPSGAEQGSGASGAGPQAGMYGEEGGEGGNAASPNAPPDDNVYRAPAASDGQGAQTSAADARADLGNGATTPAEATDATDTKSNEDRQTRADEPAPGAAEETSDGTGGKETAEDKQSQAAPGAAEDTGDGTGGKETAEDEQDQAAPGAAEETSDGTGEGEDEKGEDEKGEDEKGEEDEQGEEDQAADGTASDTDEADADATDTTAEGDDADTADTTDTDGDSRGGGAPARDFGSADNPDFACNPDQEPDRTRANPKATEYEERQAAEAAKDPLDNDAEKAKKFMDGAMNDINKEYTPGDNDVAPDRDCEPVKFDTPEDRDDALNRQTQNHPGDPDSEHQCGPAAVIAGAIQAGGEDGVRAVAQDAQTYDADGNLDAKSQHIQDMLDDPNHQWTRQDLHDIQDNMYQQMRDAEGDTADSKPGVDADTVQNYVNSDPELAQMYKDNGVEVDRINNGSTDKDNGHFVMTQRDPDNQYAQANKVYDPYSRSDGNQVITSPSTISKYNTATTDHVRGNPDAANACQ